jgi:hypothetical protein
VPPSLEVVLTAEPSVPAAVLRTSLTKGPGHTLLTRVGTFQCVQAFGSRLGPTLWLLLPSERLGSGLGAGGLAAFVASL